MKKCIFLILATMMTISVMAQEEAAEKVSPWKCTGVLGLNASATGLVNWSAGGNNNVAGLAFGKVRLLYDENNLSWETNLNVEYGMSYIDQQYDKLQKTNDAINFTTKFGWQFSKAWYLTALAGFQSQFAIGQKYPGDGTAGDIVSKFLAPSYTDITVGIDWKPNSIFSVYLSPIAGRITSAYVSNAVNEKYAELYPTKYPIVPGVYDGLRQSLQETYGTYKYSKTETALGHYYEKEYTSARSELGLNIKGSVNYTYKELKIITTLGLFTPYAWDKTVVGQRLDGSDIYRDNNRRFGNFDVDWDVAISYQFLKVLNVTLSTSLKYYPGTWIDKTLADGTIETKERVQFKSILGLGIGYSF